MHLDLFRYAGDEHSTAGLLFFNGEFFCHTCEDEQRDVKVQGQTRIPAGTYRIKLRDAGGMVERYKAKFPFHKGMLHLQNVPGFEWIYIHIGNTHEHTEGCILVGDQAIHGSTFKVGQSEAAYMELYLKALDAKTMTISVWDSFVSEFYPTQ